ncbi:MAG: hypothetical protein RIR18_1487 [Pseudomonadota bacterium]|jgi:c-di-GMP-binding flagellar brake protein YcgR
MAAEKKVELDEGPKLVKVLPGELDLGGKIMCMLYNGDRRIIRTIGQTITNQSDLDGLFSKGLYKLEGDFVHKRNDAPARSSSNSKFRRGAGGRRLDVSVTAKPKKITEVPLEKTKVKVGMLMQLQPKWPDAPRYTVRLIGYQKDMGIMVTAPEMTGEYVMIREWDGFTVRFFSGLAAYAFDTSAMKQTLVPYPMLHLTYPKTVRFQQIRTKPRLELELIAVAHNEAKGLAASVRIADLSVGGASLNSKTPLGKTGDDFKLKFKVKVEEIEVLMELDTQIRKSTPSNEDPTVVNYGVSFQNVPDDMELALSAFVNNAMLDMM